MTDTHVAQLLARAQLGGCIQDFLDPRMSGERDLIVRGSGFTLEVFRGDEPTNPRVKN